MDPIECNTHSFIIKIWLEENGKGAGGTRWRGRITHVASGAHKHFQELQHTQHFIRSYLQEMGIEPTSRGRVRRWLKALLR